MWYQLDEQTVSSEFSLVWFSLMGFMVYQPLTPNPFLCK